LKKDIVAGLGEIGQPIFSLINQAYPVTGFDQNENLIPEPENDIAELPVRFLHLCIPFNEKFSQNVDELIKKFNPEGVIIHSTVSPKTTFQLQEKNSIPIIYSATRGVHKRMLNDLKTYVKFFAIEDNAPKREFAIKEFSTLMTKCGVVSKQVSSPVTLELSKIVCDTSYYGWLINYAQISKMISDRYGVDYDEMWTFADEIHENLGNRPKMFPGFIGGHCVIPNLELIDDKSLSQINEINEIFKNFLDSIK
tara:strand:+ start:183 stop:938 length:756 start_codon:yes stop_codon:yes gene_type:complete